MRQDTRVRAVRLHDHGLSVDEIDVLVTDDAVADDDRKPFDAAGLEVVVA